MAKKKAVSKVSGKRRKPGKGGPRPGSGRPKMAPGMKKRTVSMRLSPEILRFLNRDESTSTGQQIESAIRATKAFREWQKEQD